MLCPAHRPECFTGSVFFPMLVGKKTQKKPLLNLTLSNEIPLKKWRMGGTHPPDFTITGRKSE
jgi:hypothetical protein